MPAFHNGHLIGLLRFFGDQVAYDTGPVARLLQPYAHPKSGREGAYPQTQGGYFYPEKSIEKAVSIVQRLVLIGLFKSRWFYSAVFCSELFSNMSIHDRITTFVKE